MRAFGNSINQFDISEEALVCLSCGVRVPDSIVNGLLNIEPLGREVLEDFVLTAKVDEKVLFYKPQMKQSLQTLINFSQEN